MHTLLSQFVKQQRRKANLTQEDLAYKSGVGLRFVRDLEQGKPTLRIDKINQILLMFNHQIGPVPMQTPNHKFSNIDEP